MNGASLLLACVLFTGAARAEAAVAPGADGAPRGSGTLLLLHYRWRHDTLTLVESRRVPAAVKIPRSWKRAESISSPFPETAPAEEPRGPLSYELISPEGRPLTVAYLREPGIRRVELQDSGETQLHRETIEVDSSDLFLRIPGTAARSIRFYRHGRPAPQAKRTACAGEPFGPQPAPVRALLAEFPLE